MVWLTLSPAAEGAGGDLVAELAARLGVELLALGAGEELLVFVHLGGVLLGLGEAHGRQALDGLVVGDLGAHRVEDVLHALLGDGTAGLGRPGLLRLGGLLLGLGAVSLKLLLLSLLLLRPGEGGLLVHPGVQAAVGRQGRGRHGRRQRVRLVAAHGVRVDGSV